VHAREIDHLNLYIPDDGVERALGFYADLLGFEVANLEDYRAGDRSLFTFRAGGDVVHVIPTEEFEQSGTSFNHLAVSLAAAEATLREALADAGVEIERERDRSGRSGADVALYVRDPFGYGVELRPGT